MSLANLVAIERFFDRGVAVYLLVLSAALAGAVVFVGV